METKIRSMIVACTAKNNMYKPFGIGINGTLPWYLPKESQYFAKTTKKKSEEHPKGIEGAPLIMGRVNYESFPDEYCPLAGRTNIVLTKQTLWQPPNYESLGNVKIVHSPWEALYKAEQCPGDELFIIGGQDIYTWYGKNVIIDRLYITLVEAIDLRCDRFFPMQLFDLKNDYNLKKEEWYRKDEKHIYDFTVQMYERK